MYGYGDAPRDIPRHISRHASIRPRVVHRDPLNHERPRRLNHVIIADFGDVSAVFDPGDLGRWVAVHGAWETGRAVEGDVEDRYVAVFSLEFRWNYRKSVENNQTLKSWVLVLQQVVSVMIFGLRNDYYFVHFQLFYILFKYMKSLVNVATKSTVLQVFGNSHTMRPFSVHNIL